MTTGRGAPGNRLSEQEIRRIVEDGIPPRLVEGKRVLVLTPDATRTCPLPLMARIVSAVVGPKARQLDFMIALGSHPVMSEQKIDALFGIKDGDRERVFPGSRFLCHRWDLPEAMR